MDGNPVKLIRLARDEVSERDRRRLHRVGPLKYQLEYYALLRLIQPDVVVETGVRFGVSTILCLRALATNGHGLLYSADPCYQNQRIAEARILEASGVDCDFTRWRFFGKNSCAFFENDAPTWWDVFLHDSDHSLKNMAYELDVAWQRIRPGGLIVCDDYRWRGHDGKPHRALERFCADHGLRFEPINTAAAVPIPVP